MAVSLLCHFDGTNGQTTTIDSSLNAHALTMNGCALSTTSPKFGTASLDMASAVSTASVSAADDPDWYFGSGQFTIEAQVKFTSAPGTSLQAIVAQFGGSSNLGWYFGMVSGNLSFFYSTTGSNNPSIGAAWTPTLNTWYHVAVDRDASNVIRVYIDGVVLASATVSDTFFNSTRSLRIGNDDNANRKLTGFIDELRISDTAVYGGAFTPPTEPFPDPTSDIMVRITQAPVLVLSAADSDARITQVATLVLGFMPDAAEEIRVTQTTALALVGFDADLLITQTAILVLADQVNCLTKWAQTWTITRVDGEVRAFTSHDMPVIFRGVSHTPCNSLMATAVELSTAMGTSGNQDLMGLLSDVGISEEDIYNGLYDGAFIESWIVPWDNAGGEIPFRLMGGVIGSAGFGELTFNQEVLSDSARLEQTALLETYTPGCRYLFGSVNDSRCPVDLSALQVSGSVTGTAIPNASTSSTRRIFTDSTRVEADGFFDFGVITWTSGANAGATSEVKDFSGGQFIIWDVLLFPIAIGDTYTATPGCDKSTADHLVFNADLVDFGGFPDVPGNDSILQSPDAKG